MREGASKRARLTTNIESRGSFEDDARFHLCSRPAVDRLGDQIELEGGKRDYTEPFSM